MGDKEMFYVNHPVVEEKLLIFQDMKSIYKKLNGRKKMHFSSKLMQVSCMLKLRDSCLTQRHD
jgi:hypothetical protein